MESWRNFGFWKCSWRVGPCACPKGRWQTPGELNTSSAPVNASRYHFLLSRWDLEMWKEWRLTAGDTRAGGVSNASDHRCDSHWELMGCPEVCSCHAGADLAGPVANPHLSVTRLRRLSPSFPQRQEGMENSEAVISHTSLWSLILPTLGNPVITIKMHMYKCHSLLRSFRIKSQCCALFPHPIVLCSCLCFVPCPTLDGALLSAAELAHPLHHLHFVLVHLASFFMFPSRCFFREPVFLGLDQGPCSLTSCTFSC